MGWLGIWGVAWGCQLWLRFSVALPGPGGTSTACVVRTERGVLTGVALDDTAAVITCTRDAVGNCGVADDQRGARSVTRLRDSVKVGAERVDEQGDNTCGKPPAEGTAVSWEMRGALTSLRADSTCVGVTWSEMT